jgi:hypothetical protein
MAYQNAVGMISGKHRKERACRQEMGRIKQQSWRRGYGWEMASGPPPS